MTKLELPAELFQGDCLTWMRSAPDACVDMVLADPPYGIAYKTHWERRGKPRGAAGRTDNGGEMAIVGDDRPFIWWLYDAFRIARECASLICFCRFDVQEVFRTAIAAAGWKVRYQIIWDRVAPGQGDLQSSPMPRHDVAWFATKGAWRFHGHRPPSVMVAPRDHPSKMFHPTQKPLKLMLELVKHYCPPRGTVFDPCVGSGVSLVAAKLLGRGYVGCEIDAAHHAVAARQLAEAGSLFSADVEPT